MDHKPLENLLTEIIVGLMVGIFLGILFGIISGVFFTLIAKLIKNRFVIKINKSRTVHIKTKELRIITLKLDRGKLKTEFCSGFKKGAVAGIFTGFLLLVFIFIYSSIFKNYIEYTTVPYIMGKLFFTFIFTLIGALISAIVVGFPFGIINSLINTFIRNQRYPRIKHPYRRFYASIWLDYFQYIVMIFTGAIIFDTEEKWILSLFVSAVFSVPVLLLTSSLYQHFVLRFCFYLEGTLLLRFVSFLNYVSKKTGLLENDGGQWRFRHQLIQDMLTEIKDEPMSNYSIPVEVETDK